MTTLRQSIRNAIVSGEGDADKAAIAVLRLMNSSFSLMGNGWLDDDPQALALMYPGRDKPAQTEQGQPG